MNERHDDAAITADREIVTTRVFDAPRELVWEAWTDPKHVAQWWGPNGFTNTIHEMDVRPGGVWRFVMHGPDGTDYRNKIVFVEVAKPERLVYDHVSGPKFHVTATFEAERGKTKLTMRTVFESAAERERVVEKFGAVEGAKQTLGRLHEYLSKMPDPNTTLELSRDFKAERGRVFDAFLDAAVLRTIWSAEAYTIVEMTVDPRVGGGWRLAMRDEATGAVGHCTARYVEMERPARIVWRTKWLDGPLAGAPEARVTLEFGVIGDGTRLKLTHEFFPDRQTRDHHGAGWSSGLERLARLLAGELDAQSLRSGDSR